MGFWGVDLYQNDTSLDVKDRIEEELRKGRNVEEITEELIEEFQGIENDLCEVCAFWFALADTQWTWGRLMPSVKERALQLLESGGDLEWWREEPPVRQLQRKKALFDLQYKLQSPPPPAKKPMKRRSYRCQWKVGDVFAYRLESEEAKKKGLYGRYFLIRKVDEGIWYPEHIVPIVYIKITEDGKLPSNLEEYDQMKYVQICISKYEDRFWPIDGRRPLEDLAEKEKLHYEVDEFGHLPHFRITILNTSQKVIPSSLIYLGNFADAAPPPKEFIPHDKRNIAVVSWKDFESYLIERYTIFNFQRRKKWKGENNQHGILGSGSVSE